MWSEDPGKTLQKTTDTREPEKQDSAERPTVAPLRWFFGFDGWRLDRHEDEFVLA